MLYSYTKASTYLNALSVLLILVLFSSCNDEEISISDSIQTFAINEYQLAVEDKIENIEELKIQLELLDQSDSASVAEVLQSQKELFSQLNQESKILFRNLGFTNSDINEILDGNDEILLTILSISLVALISEKPEQQDIFKNTNYLSYLGVNYKQNEGLTWSQVGSCAAIALGLDVIGDLRGELHGKKMTKKVLKKAFKKVAGRLLSYVTGWGLAITASYFVGCLAYHHFAL